MSAARRNGNYAYDYHAAPTEETPDGVLKEPLPGIASRRRKSKIVNIILRVLRGLPLYVLALFGALHVFLVVAGRLPFFWDIHKREEYLRDWGQPDHVGDGLANYPTDTTRDVLPIPCHSHNDYWRRVPLFEAIHYGCTSVEADVWLLDGHEELYVGHNTASLTPNRTFTSLYIDPLRELLDNMNPQSEFGNTTGHGVFDQDPSQTLVLLVDLKTNGRNLYPIVHKRLEPLRQKNYLSYWDGNKYFFGAITVVGTGNAPFDLITENNNRRDIFFDAPLDELWEPTTAEARKGDPTSKGHGKTGKSGVNSADRYNSRNSYYASTSFLNTIGYPWNGRLSSAQLDKLRGQIRGAKRRALKARYWDTPSWPTSLRNHIWQVLVQEGADVLNVDDLKAAATLDWNVVRHDWFDA